MRVTTGPKGQVRGDRRAGAGRRGQGRQAMSAGAGALALLLACAGPPAPQPEAVKAEAKVEAKAEAKAPQAGKPTLVAAPAEGEVGGLVQAELARGSGPLVVYVGATWCDPCRVFHEALVRGDLDRELAGVRFLEFDLDRDKARLIDAGYESRLIPLFALPGPDGRASGRQIEGGIRGPQAALHIVARLVPLIAGADNVR